MGQMPVRRRCPLFGVSIIRGGSTVVLWLANHSVSRIGIIIHSSHVDDTA